MAGLRFGDLSSFRAFATRRHQREQLAVQEAGLQLKADIAQAQLQQGANQHADKMSLGYAQLDFQRQSAELQAKTALQVAEVNNRAASMLSMQNHNQAMQQIHANTHAGIVTQFTNTLIDNIASSIRQREEVCRAVVNALATAYTDDNQARLSGELKAQEEQNRQAERSHEIARDYILQELETLRSSLRKDELTHEQVTSRVHIPLILRELGLFEAGERPTEEDVTRWMDAMRAGGIG